MSAPDPLTEADLARVATKSEEVARGCHQGYADRVWWREMAQRLAVEVVRLRAPVHYAAVGHLCGAWEHGARSTSDHSFVTCGDCREHFHHDDPEQGIRQTRFGKECPKCWETLPPCDDGDVVKCPECKTEFLRADGLPALFPMEPEAEAPPGPPSCEWCKTPEGEIHSPLCAVRAVREVLPGETLADACRRELAALDRDPGVPGATS